MDWRFRSGGRAIVAVLLAGVLISACAMRAADEGPSSADVADPLAGTTWRLVEFVSSDDAIGTVRPADPTLYTIALQADGSAALRLHCNRGSGRWSAEPVDDEGGEFRLGPLAVTRAYCPSPSMGDQIARHAESMRSFLLRDGRLFVNLMADGGTYVWEPADGAG